MKKMGKKKRLNRFITKWIKSDLPEERSTVLLLGVTRIPTSPVPARRPCSLPLTHQNNPDVVTASQRRGAHRKRIPPSSQNNHRNDGDSGIPPDSRLDTTEACSDTSHSNNDTPSNSIPVMDRSVDSIGTCSLDVDASADLLSDWSENSSAGTLRSFSLKSPAPQEARLPSYLSLACTVNGYSTTTNYDPERLAKSRDTSPHRPNEPPHDNLTYAVHNNLLSPPNLVPLPMQKYNIHHHNNMAERTITHHHHQEFYTSTKSVSSYISKESRSFTSSLYGKDAIDACLDGTFRNGIHQSNKQVSYESKTVQSNGQTKSFTESVQNGAETKSFIQQRVERLYGPGALAQGFFVMKRQKSRNSESDHEKSNVSFESDKHSKSMSDKLLEDESFSETSIRQSTSSPSLPVLRHLTPEFRAQLPIFSPRKGGDSSLSKSNTLPVLKDEVNGHHPDKDVGECAKPVINGCHVEITGPGANNAADVKDGHYFLKVLEKEAGRLLLLADKAEEYLLEQDLNEDTKGYLRSASGKARLLVSQKMQQFKGLCTNNITQVEGDAFPTTNEDLQGFWDMVMLQVDQIDTLFKELEELKSNNWVEIEKPVDVVDKAISNSNNNKPRKAAVPRAQTAGAEEARKKREAQRKKMIEDRRKAMREQKQAPQQTIEIYMPETS